MSEHLSREKIGFVRNPDHSYETGAGSNPTTPLGVKKADLDKRLRECGWWLARQGSRHEVWTNGKVTEAVPRHREIDEYTARSILRKAREQRVKP